MERVKGFFDKTLPTVEHLPHGPLLRNEIENLRRKDPDIILHDELEPLNEPLYLLQFAQWAQAHGLTYVGDTSLINDWLAIYPKEVKQALLEHQMSRMQGLQYADFLMNRDFRRSRHGTPTPQAAPQQHTFATTVAVPRASAIKTHAPCNHVARAAT
jgi:hypothetical protein